MARTTQQIADEIETAASAETDLSNLNSPSSVAIWRAWRWIVAQSIQFFEQLLDLFKEEIQAIADSAVSGNEAWIRAQVLKFQYSATEPQVIQLIDFVPTYPVEDPLLRVVTRVATVQAPNRKVTVKTAKGETGSLQALSADELIALKSYVNEIQFSGTNVEVISLNPDRAKLSLEIYFKGQYGEALTKSNVINAIEEYFAELDFAGTVELIRLVDKIQAVPGVKDVVILEAKARESSALITSSDAVVFTRIYETVAGYIIPEDSVGHTLDDTISMIPA